MYGISQFRDSVSQKIKVWSSSNAAIIGANKSNDYSYDFEEIVGRTYDSSPIVIPLIFNASATLGEYANTAIMLDSVTSSSVTVKIYNSNEESVNLYIRLIIIDRD